MEIVKYLLTRDRNLANFCNLSGDPPIILATANHQKEAIRELIEAGADVNYCIPNTTLLHQFVTDPEFTHYLILKNANLDATDFLGCTPMHYAVREGCLETLSMLLYYNADANVPNRDGVTPFMEALMEKCVEAQLVLMDYVWNWNAYASHKGSVLEIALKYNSFFVKDIIDKGAVVSFETLYVYLTECQFEERIFQLIWDNLNNIDNMKLMAMMRKTMLDKVNFEIFINVITESSNSQLLLEFVSGPVLMILMTYFSIYYTNINLVSKFIFRLLENSYPLDIQFITKVFYQYGNCELFQMLRYFDYDGSWSHAFEPIDFLLKTMFDINTSIKDIKKEFYEKLDPRILYCLKHHELYRSHVALYFELFTDHQLKDKCLISKINIPTVPTLVELARDASREHIIKNFNVSKTLHYYTIVDHLNIKPTTKEILKFDKQLHDLTQ